MYIQRTDKTAKVCPHLFNTLDAIKNRTVVANSSASLGSPFGYIRTIEFKSQQCEGLDVESPVTDIAAFSNAGPMKFCALFIDSFKAFREVGGPSVG